MCELDDILGTKPRVIYSVPRTAPVVAAVKEMCAHHIGALLVHDSARFIGIVSERDIMERLILHGLDPSATGVAAIMTERLVCVPLETEPIEVERVMMERNCRHIPVLKEGRIVGIVSRGDLARWAIRNLSYESRTLRDYVVGTYPG